MRSIGVPEFIIIFGVVVAGIVFTVRRIGRQASGPLGSRSCPHCQQRIPDFGTFCPICGQKFFQG